MNKQTHSNQYKSNCTTTNNKMSNNDNFTVQLLSLSLFFLQFLHDILDLSSFFLQGLNKEKDKRENVKNSFWVYSIKKNRW